jgi:prepilin-type N-terminal cleavage/methylation domain-containing protein
MKAMQSHHERRQPREAFSLVEMLIVLAIIGVLASLSFVLLGKSGEAAREAATKTGLKILNAAIRERIEAFHDLTASGLYQDPDTPTKMKNRLFRAEVEKFMYLYRRGGGNMPRFFDQQAEIYVRKTMFKSLFPQRLEDMYGYNGVLDGYPNVVDDSPILARMYNTSGTAITGSWMQQNIDSDLTESSELLYLVLTSGDVFGLPPSDLDGIDQSLIGDTDADGNLEFLDAWGKPLQFYNWPTRLVKDDGANFTGTLTVANPNSPPATLTFPTTPLLISNLPNVDSTVGTTVTAQQNRNRVDRDPDDVLRVLSYVVAQNPLRVSFNLRGSGAAYPAVPFTPAGFHDANTYSSPLLVSPGPDGDLGLYLPTDNPNLLGAPAGTDANHLARVIATEAGCQALGDNLTNLQRGPN